MRKLVIQAMVSLILCGLHFGTADAHAQDARLTEHQLVSASEDMSALQTFLWDFSLPSNVRAGRSSAIAIEAWSDSSGVTSSTFKFYLSKDSKLDVTKDRLIGQLQANLTGPSSGSQRSLFYGTFQIPRTTKAGNYYFFITVDGRERSLSGAYFDERIKIKSK